MAEFAVGRLVEPTDDLALADALTALLADDDARAALGDEAARRAAAMTWTAAAAATAAVYREALAACS
jgi:glycosyltransferase involved in cell wall biosynthesis